MNPLISEIWSRDTQRFREAESRRLPSPPVETKGLPMALLDELSEYVRLVMLQKLPPETLRVIDGKQGQNPTLIGACAQGVLQKELTTPRELHGQDDLIREHHSVERVKAIVAVAAELKSDFSGFLRQLIHKTESTGDEAAMAVAKRTLAAHEEGSFLSTGDENILPCPVISTLEKKVFLENFEKYLEYFHCFIREHVADILEGKLKILQNFLIQWTRALLMYARLLPDISGSDKLARVQIANDEERAALLVGHEGVEKIVDHTCDKDLERKYSISKEKFVIARVKGEIHILPYPYEPIDELADLVQNYVADMISMLSQIPGTYVDRVIAILGDIFETDVLEKVQAQCFPDFKPHYPNLLFSDSATRKQVDIVECFEALPVSLREAIVEAGIPIIELTAGCEERCRTCGFDPDGQVDAEFTADSVKKFVRLYHKALSRRSMMYWATEPFNHPQYAQIHGHCRRFGLPLFTSSLAPHGRERDFMKFIRDNGATESGKRTCTRLSVMPNTMLRATVLAVFLHYVLPGHLYEFNNQTGFDSFRFSGRTERLSNTQRQHGRALRNEDDLDPDDIGGITCKRGVIIHPKGGPSMILPTVITTTKNKKAGVNGRLGYLRIPITSDTTKILCHKDSDYGNKRAFWPDGIFLNPVELMVRGEDGVFRKEERHLLETGVAELLSILENRAHPGHEFLDFLEGTEPLSFYEPSDDEISPLLRDLHLDDNSISVLECFDAALFKLHIGEQFPRVYLRRILGGMRVIAKVLEFPFEEGPDPGKILDRQRKLIADGYAPEAMVRLPLIFNKGRAVLKSLQTLDLL